MIEYVRINGNNYEVNARPIWQRNARSEREYGRVVIKKNRRERYEMYSLIELVQEDTSIEQYLIQADQVREESPNYFTHTLALTETMAIFDTIYPAARSFRTRTGEQKTIRDILTVYKREIEYYQGYTIDFEEGAWLDKKLTEKEYEGQNMSSILTNLFNAIRANPKCYYDKTAEKWVLYPQFFKHRNNIIDPIGNTYYYEQNSLGYATKAKVQAKNAIYEDLTFSWFPSRDGWILPRSEGFVMSASRAQYEIDSNMLGIGKVVVKVTAATSLQTADIDIDITDHVLTEEEFDALIDNGEQNKNLNINKYNSIKYSLEDNRIYQLESSGSWWVFEKQIRHLKNAIEYEFLNNRNYYESQLPPTQEGETWGLPLSKDTKEIPMRITYLRQRDVDYTVNRMNSKGMTASTQLYSQTASRIDLDKQKENMALMSNRLGNNTEFITKMFNPDEYIWQVFDYTEDGKVVVEAKYTEHHNGTYGEFELADNFANIKGEESITRDPSPYTITGKKFMTNVIEENYIVFSEAFRTNNTILSDNGIEAVKDTLEEAPDNTKRIDFAVYKRPDGTPLHMPVMAGGSGFTSTFHVHWKRPIIAGWSIEEIDGTDMKQPIVYTGGQANNFTLDNYRLYHTNGGAIEDTGEYPIIIESGDLVSNALTEENIKPIDLGLNDSFAHTLVLHAMTESENINVGYRFSELLALHNSSPRTLKLWKSATPYTIADQEPRDTDALVSGGSIIHTRSQQKIEVTGSESFAYWAITDGDNLIMLSGNNVQEVYYSIQSRDITSEMSELNNLNAETHRQPYDVWGYVSVIPARDLRGAEQTQQYYISGSVGSTEKEYTVAVGVYKKEGGTATQSGSSYKDGESVTVEATAYPGYYFKEWLSGINEVDGATANPFAFIMKKSYDSQNIVANFEEDVPTNVGLTAEIFTQYYNISGSIEAKATILTASEQTHTATISGEVTSYTSTKDLTASEQTHAYDITGDVTAT